MMATAQLKGMKSNFFSGDLSNEFNTYRWPLHHNDHFQLGTACHFCMLDLFTAYHNRLELSLLDCRKLYITTIYDRNFHSSFQKNEPTVHPTIGIDVFH